MRCLLSNGLMLTTLGIINAQFIAGRVSLVAGSIAGGTIADLRDHPIEQAKGPVDMSPEAEQDEFEQRLQQMEKVCSLLYL